MKSLILDFLAYLKAEQRASACTVEAYGRDLRQFASWLDTDNPTDTNAALTSATASAIRSWTGTLADNGKSATTLRRKVQSLRAFYNWAMKHGLMTGNPAAEVTLAKKRRTLPDFIKETEVEELLEEPHDSFSDERAYIAVTLMYSLGLRQAELLALTDRDIDFLSEEIRVTGKRDKQRVLPLPATLAEEIAHWQSVRDSRYPDLQTPAPIMAGPHGKLSKGALYGIVKNALAGVSTGRKSPHTLRHTFATAMINNGADLDAVREMLGHESLATTQIYTHLSFSELLASYRTAHPRSHPRAYTDKPATDTTDTESDHTEHKN